MSEPVKYADRVYRSGSALVAGVLLLGLVGWLGGDALLHGPAEQHAREQPAVQLLRRALTHVDPEVGRVLHVAHAVLSTPGARRG